MAAPNRFVDKRPPVTKLLSMTATVSNITAKEHSVVAVNWAAVNVRSAPRKYEQSARGGFTLCVFRV